MKNSQNLIFKTHKKFTQFRNAKQSIIHAQSVNFLKKMYFFTKRHPSYKTPQNIHKFTQLRHSEPFYKKGEESTICKKSVNFLLKNIKIREFFSKFFQKIHTNLQKAWIFIDFSSIKIDLKTINRHFLENSLFIYPKIVLLRKFNAV